MKPRRVAFVAVLTCCLVFLLLWNRRLPEEAPYSIELFNSFEPAMVTLLLDDTVLFSSSDWEREQEMTGPLISDDNPDGPGKFSVLVGAPWGSEEIDVAVDVWGNHKVLARKGIPTSLKLIIPLETYPIGHLYVDNRDHEQVELEIGQFAVGLPADTTIGGGGGASKGLVFLLPRSPANAEVRINGQPVGVVALATDSTHEPLYLLDTSGNRAYNLQHVKYGGYLFQTLPSPTTLSGGYLHRIADRPLDRIYFLSEAPELTGVARGDSVLGFELTEVRQR